MRKILIIILILLCFFSRFIYATEQMGDKLKYKNNNYLIHAYPLDDYFDIHTNQKSKFMMRSDGYMRIRSTGLGRGYVVTWVITNKNLILKDIETQEQNNTWNSIISTVFSNRLNIKANWYSGIIFLIQKKSYNSGHRGRIIRREKYIIIKIKNGELVEEKRCKGEKLVNIRNQKFEELKKTDKYKKKVEELKIKKKPPVQEQYFEAHLYYYFLDDILSMVFEEVNK